jgi:hypothetical protein
MASMGSPRGLADSMALWRFLLAVLDERTPDRAVFDFLPGARPTTRAPLAVVRVVPCPCDRHHVTQ